MGFLESGLTFLVIYGRLFGPLLLAGGLVWLAYLWSQLRRDRLYYFTITLRSCVRRNLPAGGAIQAMLDERTAPADALQPVLTRLVHGDRLGVALAAGHRLFTPEYVALVDLGERTGQLPTVLDHLAADLEERRRTRSWLFALLAYPFAVLMTYSAIVTFIMLRIAPKFRDIFREFDREPTHAFEGLLSFYNAGGGLLVSFLLFLLLLIPIGLVVVNAGGKRLFPKARRRLRRLSARLPFGRRQAWADFAASMAAAVAGGATLPEALRLSAAATAPRLRSAIHDARVRVENGETLGNALDATHAFPKTFLWIVRCGESAGRLDEAFRQLDNLYVARVQQTTQFLGAMAVPLVTCIMAGIVAILAIGVLGMLADLTGYMASAEYQDPTAFKADLNCPPRPAAKPAPPGPVAPDPSDTDQAATLPASQPAATTRETEP